jgi:hypothetical protein
MANNKALPAPPARLQVGWKQLQQHWKAIGGIFGLVTTGKSNHRVIIGVTRARDGTISGSLQKDDQTVTVRSDRDYWEAAVVLAGVSKRAVRLLVGFHEKWSQLARESFEFHNVSLRFYLQPSEEDAKQCFRLEWEDRNQNCDGRRVFSAAGAAHPHWQFDRWLTNSDGERLEELRRELVESEDRPVREFSANDGGSGASIGGAGTRRNLSWFTKIHFPATAKWPVSPIASMESETQPHAEAPASLVQIENWIGSSLRYVRHQGTNYLP